MFKVVIFISIAFVLTVLIIVVGNTKNEGRRLETEDLRLETEKMRIDLDRQNITTNIYLDKFTYCLQTVMIESAKNGKPIDANKARDVCNRTEK